MKQNVKRFVQLEDEIKIFTVCPKQSNKSLVNSYEALSREVNWQPGITHYN